MTQVPSSKIPTRDLGSFVSKKGVNPHGIVRIKLDDTSKQRLMHEHVGKRTRMQKSKESQTCGTKQARQISSHGVEKGVHQAHQHHEDASHKRLSPNKPQERWRQPHKQVAQKTDKHKPTEGKKHGKA